MDWEKIWSDHWEDIYVYVFIRVRHKQESEDITQETFIKAIRSEGRYTEGNVNIVALLKTIARNLIIDRWRKKQKNQDPLTLEPEMFLTDKGSNTEKFIEQKEAVSHALSLLNDEQRKVVECRLLKDLSVKETASLLNKSETYVKVTQFRAIKKVKDIMKKQFLEEALH